MSTISPTRNRKPLLVSLEHAILSGELPSGTKLPSENALCLEHRLSRASVREVLQSLKARSLVESRRGSGTYVDGGASREALRQSFSAFSALRCAERDFRELMDLRLLLECECVKALTAAEAAPGRRALRARLHVMNRCKHDLGLFAAADIDFHREIVRHSGHRLFREILEGLYDGVAMRFARATYVNTALTSTNLAAHEAVCEALEAGESERASSLLRRHLKESRTHLERLLTCAREG